MTNITKNFTNYNTLFFTINNLLTFKIIKKKICVHNNNNNEIYYYYYYYYYYYTHMASSIFKVILHLIVMIDT